MKVEEARDLFNAVDTDKNGLLDFKELVTFLTSVFEASPFLPAGV
jgi:Ca2+-binding EF-hand superfamily protein